MKNKHFKQLLVRTLRSFMPALLILLTTGTARAVDLDRLFPQMIDAVFFAELRTNEGCERAVFIELADTEKTFYLRYSGDRYFMRGHLEQSEEKYLTPTVTKAPATIYSPVKQNGEPLYNKGKALSGCIRSNFFGSASANTEFLYVPHLVASEPNDAFVSDYGYLEIRFNKACELEQTMPALIKSIFGENAKIMRQVRLNRYYLYRDNYRGPVDFVKDNTAGNLIFYPVHKATLNKNIADHISKSEKDRQLTINLIAREKYLYSQDMRLKLGMVPGFVSINWQHIDNTDIGSGQNHLVFLSIGPGINYFDDPWKQPRNNVPCPRLYFHKDIVNLDRMQLYPTYSIEPKEKGTGRLAAINIFQKTAEQRTELHKKVVWSSSGLKASLLPAIEESLCQYGLTNSSADLEPGFVFKRCFFNGNVINNEIRLYQAAAVRDYMTAVIIPPGGAEAYLQAYQSELASTSRHWEYNCGVHFSRLFVEATESTDRGFRETWLMMVLKESHPTFFRIMKRAVQNNKMRAFSKIADKVSAMARQHKRQFFITPYFCHYQALSKQKYGLWLEYLESYRNHDKLAPQKFERFAEFDRYLEKICD